MIAWPINVSRKDSFDLCSIIQLLSVLRKQLVIGQFIFSLFLIAHHTGSKLIGTDLNTGSVQTVWAVQ